ncbi:phosphotyrosine protein phosphatase [Nanoarchaeota archaeon]
MKVLFICNQNQNRSKTAEEIFKDRYITMSAGLYNENPVTENEIKWADLIVVMEEEQRSEIAKRFPKLYLNKKIINLDVPDIYNYNQPELINSLKLKVNDLTID